MDAGPDASNAEMSYERKSYEEDEARDEYLRDMVISNAAFPDPDVGAGVGAAAMVDLTHYKLESHVREAIAAAMAAASDAPVDAVGWLWAALGAPSDRSSPAFDQLRSLLQQKVRSERPPSSSVVTSTLNLRVTPALARSLTVARPYLADTGELWGRDYVAIGLLADEPSLDEMLQARGHTTSELQRAWLEYVLSGPVRRSAQAWRAWWAAAGVQVASGGVSESVQTLNIDSLEHTDVVGLAFGAALERARGAIGAVDVLVAMTEIGQPTADPEWAADFAAHHLGTRAAFVAAVVDRTGFPPTNPSSPPTPLKGPCEVTVDLVRCLTRATDIAARTTGRGRIGGRQLLAALIVSDDPATEPESLALLREAGIDVAQLRQHLYDWLRGFGDDDDAWHEILIGGARPRQRADFDADVTDGPDLLNIEGEVQALATLIAARDSVPPLSVGLFGDWGSGKTFFMRRLQKAVGALSREARESGVMQRELPFYKHVVQIEFNAWHYAEGNLWASLVEHILSNLRVADGERGTATEELQKRWLDELGFAEQARVAADRATDEARREVDAADRALNDAEAALEQRKIEFASLSAEKVLRDFTLSGAGKAVRDALDPLGLATTGLGESAGELQAALSQARSVVQRGWAALTPLLRAKDRAARWRWLLVTLVGAPLVALLVGLSVAWYGKAIVAQLAALTTGSMGLLVGLAAWLRKQASWMSEQVDKVETAQKVYDKELREHLAQTEREKTAKEQDVELARQKVVLAERTAEQARQREKEARVDIEAASTTRLLGQFIQDRAASADYRKHLGVLAVVRQDFEKLSRLIEEENWRLSPERDDEPRFAKSLRKIDALDKEDEGAATRINRIVLYIDDLDRCSPAKVVDVLQAVHLLLAFPLFVVVVGVDARWVSRSLESRYRELLHAGEDPAALEQTFGVARSRDYLEKIFQIPLWLRPMDRADAQRLVLGMLSRRGTRAATPVAPAAGPSPQAAQRPDLRAEAGAGVTLPVSAVSAGGRPAPLAAPGPSATSPSAPPAVAVSRRPAILAEQLRISDHEHARIDSLAPLLGRSPRSLKRFVNVYRLIKAGLMPVELATFVRPGQFLDECGAVLLLLAVDTGLPQVSREFRELVADPGGDRGIMQLLDRVDDRIDEQGAVACQGDWQRLKAWMKEYKTTFDPSAMSFLRTWAPRVARYSFQAPHAEAAS